MLVKKVTVETNHFCQSFDKGVKILTNAPKTDWLVGMGFARLALCKF